jgi:hypothetical protein
MEWVNPLSCFHKRKMSHSTYTPAPRSGMILKTCSLHHGALGETLDVLPSVRLAQKP